MRRLLPFSTPPFFGRQSIHPMTLALIETFHQVHQNFYMWLDGLINNRRTTVSKEATIFSIMARNKDAMTKKLPGTPKISSVYIHRHSSYKIYSLKLYQLLNFTLHSKANACNIETCFKFYMQMWVEKKQSFCI